MIKIYHYLNKICVFLNFEKKYNISDSMILLNKFIKNYIQLSTDICCGPDWGCNNYAVLGKKIFCHAKFDTSDLFCIERRTTSFHLHYLKSSDERLYNSFDFYNKYISINLSKRNVWDKMYCYVKDEKFNVNISGNISATCAINYRFDGYIAENPFEWPPSITLPQFIEQYGNVYHDKNLSLLT